MNLTFHFGMSNIAKGKLPMSKQIITQTPPLSEIWKTFVGSSSAVSFRTFTPDDNPDLTGITQKLKALGALFAEPELKQRYFELSPSSLPRRVQEWAESRLCLIDVIEKLMKQGAKPSEILLSISHTAQATLAVASLRSAELTGIGVDLESSDRKISPRAAASFQFAEEKPWMSALTSLHFWVIKEACYKANPKNKDTIIADYRITEYDALRKTGKVSNLKDLSSTFFFQWLIHDKLALAFATHRARF